MLRELNLTPAPSHVVSAGGVSFTVPAGSPQEETSDWKNMKFVWEDIELAITITLIGLPSGNAVQVCKGRDRQSQCHTNMKAQTQYSYPYQTHTVKPVFITDSVTSSMELIEVAHIRFPHVAGEG